MIFENSTGDLLGPLEPDRESCGMGITEKPQWLRITESGLATGPSECMELCGVRTDNGILGPEDGSSNK